MEAKGKSDQALDPFTDFINLENFDIDDEENEEKAVSTMNPNEKDDRRLFQVHTADLSWNPQIPYDQQPNRLEQNGPIPLLFPDHFLEMEGGVVVIYWQKERSIASICCIISVDESNSTFTYRAYGYQGKSRKTFNVTGKDKEANEKEVWRMVHRAEFERKIEPGDIQTGQTIRVMLKEKINDITVFVQSRKESTVHCSYFTGQFEGESITFHISKVISVIEIMSSPLFYRYRNQVAGEKAGKDNIVWKQSVQDEDEKMDFVRTPRMHLSAPQDCNHKRVWHFYKLFPREEFEYCTRVSLREAFDEKSFTDFSATPYFAAWVASRRIGLGPQTCYRKDLP